MEELAYEAEDMVRTAHPGINVWRSEPPSEVQIADLVASITEACQTTNTHTLLSTIKDAIPETRISSTPLVHTPPMSTADTAAKNNGEEPEQDVEMSRVA